MKSRLFVLSIFLFVSSKLSSTVDSFDYLLLLQNTGNIFLQNVESFNDKDLEKNMIDQLKELEKKSDTLTNQELKSLALGYALIENSELSTQYLQRYIKQALETKVLENPIFDKIRSTNEFEALDKKYSKRLDFIVLLLFSCGLIGVFLFIVLNLRKKGDFMANILISTFILFHSLFALHACIFMSRYNYQFPHSLYLTTCFSFFYGPLLYFYYRRISEKYTLQLKDILHVVPSVAIFLYLINIYLLPVDQKMFLMFNRDDISYLEMVVIIGSKLLSLIIYAFLVLKIYAKTKKTRKKRDPQILKWQRNLMLLNFGYVLGYILFALGRLTIFSSHVFIYPQIFLMTFIILYVGYIAYVQPRVFSKKFLFKEIMPSKYQNSGLTTSFSTELRDKLIQLFLEEKIYRQNTITLADLAERLNTSRHNISQVINEHFGVNFFNLINNYRIEEAKEILKNDLDKNLNIIDVAYDVGFNNKVTFNKAFKIATSMTPSNYVKSLNS